MPRTRGRPELRNKESLREEEKKWLKNERANKVAELNWLSKVQNLRDLIILHNKTGFSLKWQIMFCGWTFSTGSSRTQIQKIPKSVSRKGEVVLLLRREKVMERSLGRAAENKTGLHLCRRVELFKTAAYHERGSSNF